MAPFPIQSIVERLNTFHESFQRIEEVDEDEEECASESAPHPSAAAPRPKSKSKPSAASASASASASVLASSAPAALAAASASAPAPAPAQIQARASPPSAASRLQTRRPWHASSVGVGLGLAAGDDDDDEREDEQEENNMVEDEDDGESVVCQTPRSKSAASSTAAAAAAAAPHSTTGRKNKKSKKKTHDCGAQSLRSRLEEAAAEAETAVRAERTESTARAGPASQGRSTRTLLDRNLPWRRYLPQELNQMLEAESKETGALREQLSALSVGCRSRVPGLAVTVLGSRTVQQAVERASELESIRYLDEFQGRVRAVARDPIASHALRRLIESCPSDALAFVVDELLTPELTSVATHNLAGVVLQTVLRNVAAPELRRLATALLANFGEVLKHPPGKFVMMALLSLDLAVEQQARLIHLLQDEILQSGTRKQNILLSMVKKTPKSDQVLLPIRSRLARR